MITGVAGGDGANDLRVLQNQVHRLDRSLQIKCNIPIELASPREGNIKALTTQGRPPTSTWIGGGPKLVLFTFKQRKSRQNCNQPEDKVKGVYPEIVISIPPARGQLIVVLPWPVQPLTRTRFGTA